MKIFIAVVAAVIILGGGYALLHNSGDKSSSAPAAQTSTDTAKTSDQTPAASTSQPTTGTDFTVMANDESANPSTLNVKKGDKITVKFSVEENEVYHGGLDFKSDVVNSQPIKPGSSDTVSFTADQSFDFTPYWYQSSIKKNYLVHVQVQ